MPPGWLPRAGVVRGVAVLVITGSVALGAACSDEDTVDTIPPPRPGRTTTIEAPQGITSRPTTTSTSASSSASRTTSTPTRPATTTQ